jgi:hypothetical protein
MKIELKNLSQMVFLNGFTQKDIESNDRSKLILVNSSLSLIIGDKLAAKLIGGQLGAEIYSMKTIVFSIVHHLKKEIVMEISCPEAEGHEVAKLIKNRNILFSYKDPLKLDYSRNIRDSILSSESVPTNLRGFFNLFVIFSCLNYWKLIIDHSFTYGSIFTNTVQ